MKKSENLGEIGHLYRQTTRIFPVSIHSIVAVGKLAYHIIDDTIC